MTKKAMRRGPLRVVRNELRARVEILNTSLEEIANECLFIETPTSEEDITRLEGMLEAYEGALRLLDGRNSRNETILREAISE